MSVGASKRAAPESNASPIDKRQRTAHAPPSPHTIPRHAHARVSTSIACIAHISSKLEEQSAKLSAIERGVVLLTNKHADVAELHKWLRHVEALKVKPARPTSDGVL